MRLWHKDLIKALPRQQLLGQWRECCAIAQSISEEGSPNHILVNKIMNYELSHFYSYGMEVYNELSRRGYVSDLAKFLNKLPKQNYCFVSHDSMFSGWHNKRYMDQCFYNLQEKYDCEGISEQEYNLIKNAYLSYNGLVE